MMFKVVNRAGEAFLYEEEDRVSPIPVGDMALANQLALRYNLCPMAVGLLKNLNSKLDENERLAVDLVLLAFGNKGD